MSNMLSAMAAIYASIRNVSCHNVISCCGNVRFYEMYIRVIMLSVIAAVYASTRSILGTAVVTAAFGEGEGEISHI